MRRARTILPRSACITLYHAMILPLLAYCSCVWDSCGQGSKEYLDKLHRRAACIIECRSVHYNELHKTFHWPSLQLRRDYCKCMLVHKCINGLAPDYLLDNFRHTSDVHNYILRNRDQLRLPFARTTKFQGSFLYNGAKTWNNLPKSIRLIKDPTQFKTALANFLNNSQWLLCCLNTINN